ncbi:MAG: antitoxin YefM [Candidatus Omnitrophota bacterium]|jgi:antitoxin YefM
MDYIVPISEARGRLPELIKKMTKTGKHLIITKNGKPDAVLLTPNELETLEIKADGELLKSIVRGQADLQKSKLYSHDDVFGDV